MKICTFVRNFLEMCSLSLPRSSNSELINITVHVERFEIYITILCSVFFINIGHAFCQLCLETVYKEGANN